MDLDVLFVGTAGSAPSARRGLPATLVRRGGDRLLFDCGEGTQRQLLRSTGLVELEEIFLTHFHADHVLGLPGHAQDVRAAPARAPAHRLRAGRAARAVRRAAAARRTGRPSRSSCVELEPNEELERDGYRIAAYATDHGVTALGYALVEDPRPGVFDPSGPRRSASRPGPDFGRLQEGETVDGRQPRPGHGRAAPRPRAS